MNHKRLYYTLYIIYSLCPTLLYAETSDTLRVNEMDEVIVVSTPKEHAVLRQQPVSSSQFGEQELNALNVHDLSQLSLYVPSFVMPAYGSRLTSSMYVRGIGSRINNPAVGVYYDNIPLMSKAAFNNHFYMLDRVDVLRGPQGTLYGQNTEGGLVRIYSKNPMNYQGTDINLGIGTAFYRKAEVAHFHRPSEQFAFMVAGFYNGQNGFFRNTHLNERNDKYDEAGAKLRLLWKPKGRLTFDVTSDYQYTKQTGFPYGLYDTDNNSTADPSTTFTNNYRRQMVNTGLSISYDMSTLLLTSTTSHQYLWDCMNMDQDYVATDYMRLMQQQKMNALTQELVLRSKTAGRWQHTTGIFGSYEWLHTTAPVQFGEAMGDFIMEQWGMPASTHSFMKFQNYHIPGDFRTPQLNIGIYHESNIQIFDRLKATIGLRYDYSQVKIDYNTQSRFNLDINMGRMKSNHAFLSEFASSQKDSYNQLLPKFGLTYTLDDKSSNIYVVASKGFRAGGYNIQMFSDIFQNEAKRLGHAMRSMMSADFTAEHTAEQIEAVNNTISYKPEESWNFEAGSHLNIFGDWMRADVAFFYSLIRNQQLSVMVGDYGFGRAMVNAGKSRCCGVELALNGNAIKKRLKWTATYSFTNARFKEYDDKDDEGNAVSYKDKHVPFIPLHKFNIGGDYRIPLGRSGSRAITLGTNVTGQGKTYWEADNLLSQKFYATMNAHIALDLGNMIFDVWGHNLTNTCYHTFLVYSKLTRQNFAQLGTPIQVGLDIRLKL